MQLVAAMGLALLVAAGVALAQTVGDQRGPGVTKTCPRDCDGTTYPDTLIGTNAPNHIEGLGGNESPTFGRSEEHTSELQSRQYLVCRLLLEKKKDRQATTVFFRYSPH